MTDREMKRLSRADLLEMLLESMRQNETLSAELADTQERLANKEILIEKSGSMAEASLQLNEVFTAAQQAADQYLENIKAQNPDSDIDYEKLKSDAEAQAVQIVADGQTKADTILAESQSKADAILAESQSKADAILAESQSKADAILAEASSRTKALLAETRQQCAKMIQDAVAESDDMRNRANTILSAAKVESNALIEHAKLQVSGYWNEVAQKFQDEVE